MLYLFFLLLSSTDRVFLVSIDALYENKSPKKTYCEKKTDSAQQGPILNLQKLCAPFPLTYIHVQMNTHTKKYKILAHAHILINISSRNFLTTLKRLR